MDKERIPIIIKEIHYWKQHKLLPATYCDFLLALYTNGEEAKNHTAGDKRRKHLFLFIAQMVFLTVLVPFSFIVIYFTKLSPILQMSLLIFFLACAIGLFRYVCKKQEPLKKLALAVVLMEFLIISVFIGNTYIHTSWINEIIIILNALGWLLYAQKKKMRYLKIVGILSLLLVAIYIVL